MATSAPMDNKSFFTEYGEANRFSIHEVIGKGSYGVVCSATDNKTGEKVAIKKITDVFEHVSDATRILREVKLLRVLKHPDIVEVKHIVLPPNPREFKDIFVIFELMETDLHQVIKANDDLTHEHHQFFLYQVRPKDDKDDGNGSPSSPTEVYPSRQPPTVHPRLRTPPSTADPVVHPNPRPSTAAARAQVRSHRERVPPRPEAQEHPGQRGLQAQDLRLWPGATGVSRQRTDDRFLDGLRRHQVVPRPGAVRELLHEVHPRDRHMEHRLHLRRDPERPTAVPGQERGSPVGDHHRPAGHPAPGRDQQGAEREGPTVSREHARQTQDPVQLQVSRRGAGGVGAAGADAGV